MMVVPTLQKKEILFLENYTKAYLKKHNNLKDSLELEKYNIENKLNMDNMD
jgi:hypothetical protein